MARYPNGEIPVSLLVSRPARGGTCLMMPGTAEKFDRLVALGRSRYGWTPVVSGPDDAYRTRPRQQYYWDTLPYPQAAFPGTSSHGGDYRGRESGALDIGNWAEIGKVNFYQLARDAGFEPNFFDWEPWHIIDWTPWAVPPKPTPTPIDESEEDEMKNCGVYYEKTKNTWVYLIFNSGSGWYHEFSNGDNAGPMPSDYNNPLATALGTTSWAKVTPGHARVIKAGLDAVRRTAVTGSLSVDIADEKEAK